LASSFTHIHTDARNAAKEFLETDARTYGATGGKLRARKIDGPGMPGSVTRQQWDLAFHQEIERINKEKETDSVEKQTESVEKQTESVLPTQERGKRTLGDD
jgi:hypothetical protein